MRKAVATIGLLVLLIGTAVFGVDYFLKSDWFLGPAEEQTRCVSMSDDAAVLRAKEALIAKPLGDAVRGDTESIDQLSVESLERPATGEIRIHLRREDGTVVWAIIYPDCTVGWSRREGLSEEI